MKMEEKDFMPSDIMEHDDGNLQMDNIADDPDMVTVALKPIPSQIFGFYCGYKKYYPPLLRDVISEDEFSDIIEALNTHKETSRKKAEVISAIILSRGAYNPTRPMFYKKVESVFDVVQDLNTKFNPRNIGFKIFHTKNKQCLIEIRFKPAHPELAEVAKGYVPKEKEYDPYPLKGKKFSKLVNS